MSDNKTLDHQQLSEFKPRGSFGSAVNKCKIVAFNGDHLIIERLKEMGLHQGLEIEFVGQAPLLGPLVYRFGNTVLALRPQEAACIQISN